MIPHRAAILLICVPVGVTLVASIAQGRPAFTIALLAVIPTFAGAIVGATNLIRVLLRANEVSARGFVKGIALSVLTTVGGITASLASMAMAASAGRGRQLRVHGRPQYAPVGPSSPWVEATELAIDAEPRLAEIADAWRTNGKTEHASVAAFAELSMELVALGAPPTLIQAAHEDALDELRHTTLCFELARDLDGRALGPQDFAAASRLRPHLGPRPLRLAQLAVSSLFDGALYEGLSARVVASLAKVDLDPRVRPVIEAIARDEARHAAHGFDVIRWCVAEGGAPVVRALEVAIHHARAQAPHGLGGTIDARYERFGLPSRAREVAEWAVIRDRTIARVERLVA